LQFPYYPSAHNILINSYVRVDSYITFAYRFNLL
jgi:hypothetical protein